MSSLLDFQDELSGNMEALPRELFIRIILNLTTPREILNIASLSSLHNDFFQNIANSLSPHSVDYERCVRVLSAFKWFFLDPKYLMHWNNHILSQVVLRSEFAAGCNILDRLSIRLRPQLLVAERRGRGELLEHWATTWTMATAMLAVLPNPAMIAFLFRGGFEFPVVNALFYGFVFIAYSLLELFAGRRDTRYLEEVFFNHAIAPASALKYFILNVGQLVSIDVLMSPSTLPIFFATFMLFFIKNDDSYRGLFSLAKQIQALWTFGFIIALLFKIFQ